LDERPRPPTGCTSIIVLDLDINRLERVYRGSAALRRPPVVGPWLLVGLAGRRGRRPPVDKAGHRACAPPPDDLRDR